MDDRPNRHVPAGYARRSYAPVMRTRAHATIFPAATHSRSTFFASFPVGPCGNSSTNTIESGSHHFGT